MATHPDREFATYILQGISQGFHIGFNRQAVALRQAQGNMRSIASNPTVVADYLLKERQAGRLSGPIPSEKQGACQISPIGLIPKRNQPGRWRLIVDLSSPHGHSVNDGIDTDLCSMQYVTLDQAVKMVQRMGKGTQLSKLDIQSAYRMVPVHADDQPLLGMRWQGEVYLDTTLPFGLRSAPKIFSAVADALTWAMRRSGVPNLMHYLDDFLFFSPPRATTTPTVLTKALAVCDILGVPVAPNKVEGPATSLTFLGILIDTVKLELRLPHDKLARLCQAIQSWRVRKACTKRELLSLIGQLQHAATVVRPGRTFLRRMIDLAARFKNIDHWIRLNAEFRADLQWWAEFLPAWNGVGFFFPQSPTLTLTTDASGTWGCGAYCLPQWFQLQWPDSWSSCHIAAKEMVPILLAAATWGPDWAGQRIHCRSDNTAVVAVINTGTARDPLLMHFLRCLFFYAAHYAFVISASHIPGKHNTGADALSRNNASQFLSDFPQANRQPSELSPPLIALAITQRPPDWTSRAWKQLFAASLKMGSPNQQNDLIVPSSSAT